MKHQTRWRVEKPPGSARPIWTSPTGYGATTADAAIDAGLRAYMLRVYNWMASGLLLTGIVAYFIAHNAEVAKLFWTTSRGARGFWIEGGQLAFPIDEFTIAGNLLDMLAAVDAVASDLVYDQAIVSPSFRVAEMTVSGS